MTDQELIQRSKEGDSEAFGELATRYLPRVERFAGKLAQDADTAADVAQDALIKAYQGIGAFKGESDFCTWIFRIVRNAFLDMQKRDKLFCVSLDSFNEDSESPELEIPDDSPLPEDVLETKELQQEVWGAIAKLPEGQRQAVVVCELKGMKYREASEALKVAQGTVQSRLSRAKDALRGDKELKAALGY